MSNYPGNTKRPRLNSWPVHQSDVDSTTQSFSAISPLTGPQTPLEGIPGEAGPNMTHASPNTMYMGMESGHPQGQYLTSNAPTASHHTPLLSPRGDQPHYHEESYLPIHGSRVGHVMDSQMMGLGNEAETVAMEESMTPGGQQSPMMSSAQPSSSPGTRRASIFRNSEMRSPENTIGSFLLGTPQTVGVVTTYPPRRKAIRAAQACDACRARKAKCDEGRPTCGFCRESQITCVYREVPPPKQDRTLTQILDRLGRVESLLENVHTNTQRDDSVDERSTPASSGTPAYHQSIKRSPMYSSDLGPMGESAIAHDDELAMPYQHTTAAHKLLQWPSIRGLLGNTYTAEGDYVLEEEGSRDEFALSGIRAQPVKSPVAPASSKHKASHSSILEEEIATALCDSYFDNIHILHPVLDKAAISRSLLGRMKSDKKDLDAALILLVFALGTISKHRTPFHPPTASSGSRTQGSKEADRSEWPPGCHFFTKALEMLGLLTGSNSLEYVQACILTGLYFAQLGRVLDSWKWINIACTSCQVLVKLKLPQESDVVRKDLILRSFWSCLQLESDILAELDLPPSGITRLEDSMSLPNGISSPSSDDDFKENPKMWMHYLAQIALRKLLNRVHTALYSVKHDLNSPSTLAIAKELDYQLEQWKLALPQPLQWQESEAPAPDINAARLRAKYVGARYIIHRPFVYHALHGISQGTAASPTNTAQSPTQAGFAGQLPLSRDLEVSCRTCLDSAVQSTVAFYAFSPEDNRPIMTNMFGTLHAQFGNLLVLQAAFASPMLKHLVAPHVLKELIGKTMLWLRSLTPVAPALQRDAVILQTVSTKLGIPVPSF